MNNSIKSDKSAYCEILRPESEIEGNYSTTQETPNREIGFGFVSCSCRACERAGEAKLRGRAGGMLLNAGEQNGKMSSGSSGGAWSFSYLLLYAWVLS